MATSTQGLVIDLIVQKCQGLDLGSIIDAPCPVFDGPEGAVGENFVVVHGWPGDGNNTNQTAQWAGLGLRARNEDYDVAVAVCCYVGGETLPDNFDVEDAQRVARANAGQIAAAIEQALVDDATLSVINGGQPPVPCFWIIVSQQPLVQGEPDDESFMGRFAQITMKVHCFARLVS